MEKRVMTPRPEEVSPDLMRVLARAGCPQGVGEDLIELAGIIAAKLMDLARPAAFSAYARVISIGEDSLELEGMTIFSSDIARKFAGTEVVSLFLATIGPGPEEECDALAGNNRFTEALLLDAAGSEMVEELLRRAHTEAGARMSGFKGTARYAPGYGDFSLAHQARIVDLLGGRDTGVAVMEGSFMLIPKKSTTGVVGWKRRES